MKSVTYRRKRDSSRMGAEKKQVLMKYSGNETEREKGEQKRGRDYKAEDCNM